MSNLLRRADVRKQHCGVGAVDPVRYLRPGSVPKLLLRPRQFREEQRRRVPLLRLADARAAHAGQVQEASEPWWQEEEQEINL